MGVIRRLENPRAATRTNLVYFIYLYGCFIRLFLHVLSYLFACPSAPIPLHSACRGKLVVHSNLSQAPLCIRAVSSASLVWNCVQYLLSWVNFGSP